MENTKDTVSRRKFIKIAAAIALLGGAAYGLPKTSVMRSAENKMRELLSDSQAQYVRQLITNDNLHCRKIMWQSAEPMTQPSIEYRLKGSSTSLTAQASNASFSDDGTENHQYEVDLSQLTPAKDYEFRIMDKEKASKWQSFQTDGRDAFKMLIFPDSQSSDYSDWEDLAQGAIKRHPDTAIFTNMGDLVDNGQDSSQWRAWFNGLNGIIDQLAFAPVMGNHECYNKNWKTRLPEAYLNYFNVPDNGSHEFQRYYYSFDYGPVHFVVLNTQDNEIDEFKPGLIKEQLQWFKKDIASTDKPWKIVLMHRDVLQYRIHNRPERKEGLSDEGVMYMPLFEQYGVDVVFTAHLHTYRNRGRIANYSSSDKGPLYILTGVAGNVRYPGLWVNHALDQFVAPQPETDNYLTMDVEKQKITIRCFLPNGDKIDEVSLEK